VRFSSEHTAAAYRPRRYQVRFHAVPPDQFPISALLSIVAIFLFFHPGLNLGIDFVGGTLLEVQAKSGSADIAKMRATLTALNLGDVQLQQFGGPADVLIPRRAAARRRAGHRRGR
jgi:preprotein translocase subunit SecF